VVGKAFLFAIAVMAGIAISGISLWAGTYAGGGEFGFEAGKPIQEHLKVVMAVLPQIILLLWAGMLFVRSEKAGPRHWMIVAGFEALLMTGCFAAALPGGLLAQLVTWMVVITLIGGLATSVEASQTWQARRGADHLESLKEADVRRREELRGKFGTVSAGAEELGFS